MVIGKHAKIEKIAKFCVPMYMPYFHRPGHMILHILLPKFYTVPESCSQDLRSVWFNYRRSFKINSASMLVFYTRCMFILIWNIVLKIGTLFWLRTSICWKRLRVMPLSVYIVCRICPTRINWSSRFLVGKHFFTNTTQ